MAIVFDFDGTIADTEWPIYEVARDAFLAHGLDMPLETWVQGIGLADNKSLPELIADALGEPPDPAVIERAAKQRRDWNHRMVANPGVVAVIEAANRAAVPLAVASSSPTAWVEPHLRRLGLIHHFVAIRTRDHVDRGKPAPDLYLSASAALGVDPDGCVAIEDSKHGCAAAKAAGMTCVVVPNRITVLDRPRDADLILDSLHEFPYERFGL
ncbi:MAG: HAD-IA family hydrolase [Acidimicrobiales bacterium]|nr:HAD-IA family hydrolase [Acidimicrobiales bacterium]